MGERRDAHRALIGKPEGRRSLGKWEDNIKMDLQAERWAAWTGFMWLRIWTGGGFLRKG
jgi:hypothetical protein